MAWPESGFKCISLDHQSVAQATGDRGSCPRSPCTPLCALRHISGQLRPPTSPGQPRIQGLPWDIPPGAGATELGGACSLPPLLVTREDTALLVWDFRGEAAGPQDRDLHILPDPKKKTLTVVLRLLCPWKPHLPTCPL